jgi:hypothetical protein
MTEQKQTQLEIGALVCSYRPRQAAIAWPLPVDAKLEELLNSARAVGERTSRREIAAAIIAMTPIDGKALSDTLHRYRLAQVGEILPTSDTSSNVVFIQHGPGPRRVADGGG